MAISEIQVPSTYTPAYNNMWHVIDSTNNAQPNFKYRFKIYVNGTYIGRPFTVSPDPDQGYGRLDVNRIVSAYITENNTIDDTQVGFKQDLNSWAKYYVVYGEEYGALSSGVTVYDGVATSSTVYAYNGSIPTLTFDNFFSSDYTLSTSSKKFMTNIPRTFRIYENQYFWLGCMADTTNKINRCEVKTYNSAGTLIDTFEINNVYNTPSSNDDHRFLSIVSGFNLNNIDSGEFSVGTPPVITDSVYSYTVKTLDNGIPGTATSETITFKIQRELCDYDDAYDVFFINTFGKFDSYRFTRFNSKSINVTRKEYKQNKGEITAGGFSSSNSMKARTQYYTEYQDKITLRSDWLNTDEAEWLAELISSPSVYIRTLVDITQTPVPVIVTNTEWDKKSTSQGEVFKLDLQVEYSVKNYRQRA